MPVRKQIKKGAQMDPKEAMDAAAKEDVNDAHMKWWCAAQSWWYTVSPQSSWRDCVAEIATVFLAAGFIYMEGKNYEV
jgi:hypothetical protein